MTNKLIGAFILAVIGLALFPVVSDFSGELTQAQVLGVDGTTVITPAGAFYNTTTGALIDLLPLLYIIMMIVGLVSYIRLKK